MKRLFLAIAAFASLCTALPAAAQFAKPEDAIKYRQSALFVMGQHFGRVGAMANGRVPFDAKVAAENADIVADMAKLPWVAFGAGTDKGGNTKAKAEIWTEQAKFKEHQDRLVGDMQKLSAAAKSGSLDQLKAAWGPNSGSCKSCHDTFRKE